MEYLLWFGCGILGVIGYFILAWLHEMIEDIQLELLPHIPVMLGILVVGPPIMVVIYTVIIAIFVIAGINAFLIFLSDLKWTKWEWFSKLKCITFRDIRKKIFGR